MYYKQLDSLRALAVMMVIVFHWAPNGHDFFFPIGSWGVELFFVLSGFLITKILLENRFKAEVAQQSKSGVLRNFILRRSIRIFPLYYLALGIILFFDRTNISGLKDHLGWFAGYASNFYFFKTQNFNYPMAHFWSLAVEEQFYIIWPLFILFLPKKFLQSFLLLAVASGIFSRYLLAHTFATHGTSVDVLTPTCIDCFAIGGLFSYYIITINNFSRLFKFVNILGLCSFVLSCFFLYSNSNVFYPLFRTLDSLFCLALIANAYKGYTGVAGAIANSKILIYIGKISYGLYIYHLLTPWLTTILINVVSRFNSAIVQGIVNSYLHSVSYVRFIVDLAILVTAASLSWFFIERPINRYKHFFTDKRVMATRENLVSNMVL